MLLTITLRAFDGYTIKSIKFNEAKDNASVNGVIKTTLTGADDSYLTKNNLKINIPYEQDFTIELVKENGVWKIRV